MIYDLIIVGSGPAGISAALYTLRAKVKTLIIGKTSNSLQKADKIENYYGIELPISGLQLQENGIKQALALGGEILQEEVLNIKYEQDYVVVTNQGEYHSKAVLLATGASRSTPNIKGLKEFEGKGISYCATCDGFFYRQKKVAVLGNGDYAISEALELSHLASSVILLTDGKELKVANEKIQVISKKIKEVSGEQRIKSIIFEDNSTLDIDGLFIAYAVAGTFDFAKKLGAELLDGKLKVNDKMETTIPGLYAAGDCIGGVYQVYKAVYEGAKAATGIIKFVRT